MRLALALLVLLGSTAWAKRPPPCGVDPQLSRAVADRSDSIPPLTPRVAGFYVAADGDRRSFNLTVIATPDTWALLLRIVAKGTTFERFVPPDGWAFERDAGCPGANFDAGDRVCVSVTAIDAAGNRGVPTTTNCALVTKAAEDRTSDRSHATSIVGPLVGLWLGVIVFAALALRWRARRLAARPELRDTNLPPARVREPD